MTRIEGGEHFGELDFARNYQEAFDVFYCCGLDYRQNDDGHDGHGYSGVEKAVDDVFGVVVADYADVIGADYVADVDVDVDDYGNYDADGDFVNADYVIEAGYFVVDSGVEVGVVAYDATFDD
jgi:hypothetical protein